MNKIICAITLVIMMISCKNERQSVDSKIKKELVKTEKMTVKIKGMTCAIGCAKRIENKLNELEGVQKAKVDFNSKLATIEYDGSIHSKESLVKFIQGIADGKTYKVE
ncbi:MULTISPECIES: heavy-metal-associated domain-containing protein [Flavobacterium]|nr:MULTISPECIES: heavy metal-associated domain-containing protein [Flavobacterium]MCJ1807222.1 cation transporter [Flavobacterium covae]MCJ1808865.1 cation transporter [Flavobacterium covae]